MARVQLTIYSAKGSEIPVRFLAIAAVAATLALAGCVGTQSPPGSTTLQTPVPISLPPQQVLSKENMATCPEAITGASWDFKIDPHYDRIQVEFHHSGVGQIGLKIQDSGGSNQLIIPANADASQPCTHAHEGSPQAVSLPAGTYRAVMEGAGVLGYHLTIVEFSTTGDAADPHHH